MYFFALVGKKIFEIKPTMSKFVVSLKIFNEEYNKRVLRIFNTFTKNQKSTSKALSFWLLSNTDETNFEF